MDDRTREPVGTMAEDRSATPGTAGARRGARLFVTVVAVVVVALGGAALVVDHRRTASVVDSATAALVAHTDELVAAQGELVTAVDAARETVARSEGTAADDPVLAALEDQIYESEEAAAPYTAVGEPSDDLDMLALQDAFVLDHLKTVRSSQADLADAVAAAED